MKPFLVARVYFISDRSEVFDEDTFHGGCRSRAECGIERGHVDGECAHERMGLTAGCRGGEGAIAAQQTSGMTHFIVRRPGSLAAGSKKSRLRGDWICLYT